MIQHYKTHLRWLMLGFVLALVVLGTAACGTFEAGVEEPTAAISPTGTMAATPTTAGLEATATATAEAIAEPTDEPVAEPAATATAEPAPLFTGPGTLHVAYVKDNNVWLWTAESGPVALTRNGGVEDVVISDDGQRIAFIRGGSLWAVNSDGSDERQLTTEADLAVALPEGAVGIRPHQMAWLPGSHTLLFNTSPQFEGPGLLLSDDLWTVDVGTMALASLLAAGEGGNFVIAPDGRQIAIITPGTIDIVDVDGSNRRQVFTYTPVITYSEYQYYAQPVWAADSGSLRVAIPPADPLADPPQATSIWSLASDGTPARFIGNIPAVPLFLGGALVSPDLSKVLFMIEETPGLAVYRPAVATITETGIGETVIFPVQAHQVNSWSPDGTRFVFTPVTGAGPAQQIGAIGAEPLPVGGPETAVTDVTWVDGGRLLFLQQAPRGWDIVLGQLDGEETLIDAAAGMPPAYDFTE